jgi:hypothetical protein
MRLLTTPKLKWEGIKREGVYSPSHLCTFALPLVSTSPAHQSTRPLFLPSPPTSPLVHKSTNLHLSTFPPLHFCTASCFNLPRPLVHSTTRPLILASLPVTRHPSPDTSLSTFPLLHLCTFALPLVSTSPPTSPLDHPPTDSLNSPHPFGTERRASQRR